MSFTWPTPEDPHDEVSAGDHLWAQRPPPVETPEVFAKRRSAEVRLVADLLHPPNHEEGKQLFNRFAHWALHETRGPLLALANSKRIFAESRRYSRRPLEQPIPPPYWPEEARERVIDETITEACFFFKRRGLREWDPDRSGLLTYFMNTCKVLFPDAYNRWVRETRLSESITERAGAQVGVLHYDAIPDWDNQLEVGGHQPGPEELVLRNELVDQVIAPTPLDDDVAYRSQLVYEAGGYSRTEGLELTGLTRSKMKTRLKQHRRLLQGDNEHGEPPFPATLSPEEAAPEYDEQPDQAAPDAGA
jgi:hypothetical protein